MWGDVLKTRLQGQILPLAEKSQFSSKGHLCQLGKCEQDSSRVNALRLASALMVLVIFYILRFLSIKETKQSYNRIVLSIGLHS